MTKIFRFDCYPHDWLLDTSRLTPEDRGIYVQIVMLIYARGGKIDNDPKWISGSCGCSSRMVAASIARLVDKDFLSISGEKISQKRAEHELNIKRTQIENGVNGARKTNEIKTESNKNSDLIHEVEEKTLFDSNPNPNPISKKSVLDKESNTLNERATKAPSKKVLVYSDDFEKFWKVYPSKSGSKSNAFIIYEKSIKGGVTHENIINGAAEFANHHARERTESRFIAHATTWLNGRRWETVSGLAGSAAGAGKRDKADLARSAADEALADLGVASVAR